MSKQLQYERQMYNEEIKIQYIEKKESEVILPCNYLQIQFSKSYKMESELNKDICNFSTKEIIEYYKILNISYGSLSVLNSHLSMYTQWCLQHNLVTDNQNHFLEISTEILNQCTNKSLMSLKVISKETLYKWLEENPNPKDNFVLLGLFEGLKGKDFCEMIKLTQNDINGNELSLCTGRTITVSNKLIDVIEDCISEDKYYSVTGDRAKVIPLLDSIYIIKNYPNVSEDVSDFQLGRRVYNGIQRSFEFFGCPYMTANSIVDSGKIHMIKERAKHYNMSNMEYIDSNLISEVEKQFNCKMVKSIFMKKYEQYLMA